MKEKLSGLLKFFYLKVIYGNKIIFKGIPKIEFTARMVLKNRSNIEIGKHFHIRSNAYIAAVNGSDLIIGKHVFINRNCSIVCRDLINIGDNCSFGPNVIIYDHDHRFGHGGILEGYNTAPITIEPNCWIGAGSIILRGSHIGEGCVIGAGSVIRGNIPAHSVAISKASRDINLFPITSED